MKPTLDMVVSPHDRSPLPGEALQLVQLQFQPKQRWVPSRFNARTLGDDGRLILWNTLSGAISVFAPEHSDAVISHLSRKGVTAPLDKVAEYLSRRGFLVADDVNELNLFRVKYGQQQWRSDICELILLSSEDCNFRCVYCYEKFQRGTMSPDVRQGVRAMVLKRAPYLRELGISWFGGEPLYGWEAVEELSPFFKDVAERHNLVHHQDMTTNGYLLTEERATKLLDWGCRTYQITIDGLPDEHNCKRVGRDGSPTYDTILDNLRSLKCRKDSFGVIVRVNFDRDNFPRLGHFLEVLSEDFGGDPRFRLRFRGVGKWGGPNDDQLSTCGIGEHRAAVRTLRKKATEVNLSQEGGIRDSAKPGGQVCYAARPYNFIVGATGKLMKCTVVLDTLDANVVGQLYVDGTTKLNDEYMSKWVSPYFESDKMCQTCYMLPGCQGGTCPLTRIRYDERECSGIKKVLKEEMRFTLAQTVSTQRAAATHAS
ncbi:MAG: radical SAM protein [Gemmatimonadota bacterium]